MDVGLPRHTQDMPDPINNPYALWVVYDQVRCHTGQAVRRQKRLFYKRAVKRVFAVGDWTLILPPTNKCKLDSPCGWDPPYLVVSLGPLRLTLIVHTFNYRIAVLLDGVKLAASVRRSRRAARQILENADIP